MRAAAVAKLFKLSPRELELIAILADGLTRKEAADRLQISVHTVDTHLDRAYRKLHCRSAVKAVTLLFVS